MPNKIAAIQKAPTPQNVKQQRSFLGLIQCYGKFIARMSLLLHPLYQLLKANVKWKCDNQCNKAFEEAKQKLMEVPVTMTQLAHSSWLLMHQHIGLELFFHTVMKMAVNSP